MREEEAGQRGDCVGMATWKVWLLILVTWAVLAGVVVYQGRFNAAVIDLAVTQDTVNQAVLRNLKGDSK